MQEAAAAEVRAQDAAQETVVPEPAGPVNIPAQITKSQEQYIARRQELLDK